MEFLETLKKYWFLIVFCLSSIGGASIWIATVSSKTFDSPEQKVTVVKYVEDSPTPEQKQRDRILDSINKVDAIRSRRKRDSLYQEEIKRGIYRDSINLLNADQMFQIKEELKNLKEKLN